MGSITLQIEASCCKHVNKNVATIRCERFLEYLGWLGVMLLIRVVTAYVCMLLGSYWKTLCFHPHAR